jgi:hypothetical protein
MGPALHQQMFMNMIAASTGLFSVNHGSLSLSLSKLSSNPFGFL